MPTWLEQPQEIIAGYMTAQVTKYMPNLYKLDFAELWGLNPAETNVNAVGDLPLGLEQIQTFQEEETGGMADEYDGYSDDVRTIDVEIAELGTFPTVIFTRAIDWSIIEVEKQATAESLNQYLPTLNPIQARLTKLGEFFNRRDHFNTLYGLQRKGIFGLLSQRGVTSVETSFTPYVESAGAYTLTSRQLYIDLLELCMSFRDRARLTSARNIMMKVPPRLYLRLVSPMYDENGNYLGTVKQMLSNPELGIGLTSITSHSELQGDNLNKYVGLDNDSAMLPTNRDRIVFMTAGYSYDRHFYPRRTLPMRPKGSMKFQQVAISASTGVMIQDKSKIWYVDFSNALS